MNHHIYNRPDPAMRENDVNRFKDPLDACAMACGLNCELISHLTFHLNKYALLKFGINVKFVGYKWCKFSIAETYHFLGFLLKISLISPDKMGFDHYGTL